MVRKQHLSESIVLAKTTIKHKLNSVNAFQSNQGKSEEQVWKSN